MFNVPFFAAPKKGTKKRRFVEKNSFARYALSLKQLFNNKVKNPLPPYLRGLTGLRPGGIDRYC